MDFKKLFEQYLLFVNRLIPQPPAVAVIGIDIGASAVKAVELGPAAGGGSEIRHWAVETLEAQGAPAALKKAVERLHWSNQLLVSSVSGKGTLMRFIDLPRMSLEDLRKSYVYELDKYFPFDPKSIYTDCTILDPEGNDKKMPVLLSAVKKEMVDERLRLFKEAGLELNRVTLNPIAAANAFGRLGPASTPSGGARALLDMGASAASLMIFKDGTLRFTRDVFIGSSQLTQKIANALGLDAAAAEALKRRPEDKLAQIMDACEVPISNLISEIRLSLDYFTTEKHARVNELFLAGGGSALGGIEGVFEKGLGLPVKIWDPLGGLPSGAALEGDIRAHAAQFGVAVGLGLSND
ncbi:MAG: type IV pilus assembly protein PilM [Candidatus Omnitrophica bacterium]|nr:type IV pilus assembly protein PilM [Candidatus Omnitrophota bacterium]MDE2008555.1 type IV pilus assembly protein PilM [Candidatus Omnitrophota bacterium]MDE2214021.1 type IV pilus assembly protein PilM [Candidatus Omnitrophota bacterium]MDE2231001.1 type IV pilus assembly protein PilM [Candidatus Omnitrophota bacterium]